MKTEQKIVAIPLSVMIFTMTLSFIVLHSALEKLLEKQIESELEGFAAMALESLYASEDKTDFVVLDHLADTLGAASGSRITFINSQGMVLGDSDLTLDEVKSIENHGMRPEVIDGRKIGKGISKRFSTSVRQNMLYVAVSKKGGLSGDYVARSSFSLETVAEEMAKFRFMLILIGLVSLCAVLSLGWFAGHMLSKVVKREQDSIEQRVVERTREMSVMQTMGGMLNACSSMDEAGTIICSMMPGLFPRTRGAISITKASRNRLNILGHWGGEWSSPQSFSPDECWALKKGHQHFSHSEALQISCPHLHLTLSERSLCVPMIAQGETMGVFHLVSYEIELEGNAIRLVSPVVKQISLALANLQLRDHLREQAIRDPLTGMYNRRFMMESLEQYLSRGKRRSASVAILMVDIDFFKRFNDTFGHEAGDMVLVNVASEIKRNIRAGDIACRYGGEEFCLVCPETSLENVPHLANKLCDSIRRLDICLNGQPIGKISVSIGVSVFPTHTDSHEELIKLADEALYRAKADGKDRAVIADLKTDQRSAQKQKNTVAAMMTERSNPHRSRRIAYAPRTMSVQ